MAPWTLACSSDSSSLRDATSLSRSPRARLSWPRCSSLDASTVLRPAMSSVLDFISEPHTTSLSISSSWECCCEVNHEESTETARSICRSNPKYRHHGSWFSSCIHVVAQYL